MLKKALVTCEYLWKWNLNVVTLVVILFIYEYVLNQTSLFQVNYRNTSVKISLLFGHSCPWLDHIRSVM